MSPGRRLQLLQQPACTSTDLYICSEDMPDSQALALERGSWAGALLQLAPPESAGSRLHETTCAVSLHGRVH